MSLFAIYLFICCVSVTSSVQTAENYDITEIKSLLLKGKAKIQYSNDRKNILLLGRSGVGKTTLSLLLTSDNNELFSRSPFNKTYNIEDKNGLIGKDLTFSNTYLPALYVDPETRANIYDCPGYDGEKSTSVDITSTLFIHDVIESSEYIKLIFLMDYAKFEERYGFLTLAEYAATMVKNLKKYEESIAVVITKDGRPDLSDSEILDLVKYYLQESHQEIKAGRVGDASLRDDVIKFIDILLSETNGEYNKLALFRSPDRLGALSKIIRIQNSKKSVKKTLYDYTNYTKVDIPDFDYTLTAKTKNNVYKLAANANNEVKNTIAKLGDQIMNYYKNREKEDVLLSSLMLMFDVASQRFKDLPDTFVSDRPENFLKALENIIKDLDIMVSDDLQKQLHVDIDFIEFLQKINNNRISITEWILALNVTKFLNSENNYYTFLHRIHNEFSEYKYYQKDTTLYNVVDLNDWGVPQKRQGITINETNFNLFATKTKFREDVLLNDIKLKRLNQILEWTLRNPARIECNNDDLIATGEFIKISEVVKSACFGTTRSIKIYAVNTIFIDSDLIALKNGLQLSIIAPHWYMVGDHKIKLIENENGGIVAADNPDLPGHNIDNFFGYGKVSSLRGLQIFGNRKQTNTLYKFDIINQYYKFFRHKLTEGLRADDLTQSLITMAEITDIFYNTLGYVKDLTGLEYQYYELRDKVDTLKFYESLLRRIEKYGKRINQGNENTDEYKLVLNYIYATTASKVINLKRKYQSNLILDITGYIDIIFETIDKYESLQKQKAIEKNQNDYRSEIDEKIEKAMYIIGKEIKPKINQIFDELNEKIKQLIKEIQDMQKVTQGNIDELEEKRRELKKTMILRAVFGSLKILTGFLEFLGPKGQAAGAIINGAVSIAEGFAIKNITLPPKKPDIPDGVRTNLNEYYDSLKKEKTDKLKNLDDAIEAAIQTVEDVSGRQRKRRNVECSNNDDDAKSKFICEMKLIRTDIKKVSADGSINVLSHKEFSFRAEKVVNEAKAEVKKNDKLSGALTTAGKLLSIGKNVVGVINGIKKDKSLIAQFDKAIEEEKVKLQQLKDYEQMIYQTMIPMVDGLKSDLSAVDKWQGQSLAELDVSRWQTQSMIRKMQYELNKATTGFTVQQDMQNCFNQLDDAMKTMGDIYERIASYKEQQSFFKYLTNMMMIKSQITVNNEILNQNIDSMDIMIDANIIIDQFTQATQAFQQYVFPFAHKYLNGYSFPIKMNGENITNSLIEKAKLKLADMKKSSRLYAVSLDPSHNHKINYGHFSRGNVTKPFYVWKNVEYAEDIMRLLNGEVVTFDANVRTGSYYNAVKFTSVNLNFKIEDVDKNEQIKKDLANCYSLAITHLGNSYYKCDSRYYIISNAAQHIWYTFAKNNETGEMPMRYNEVYVKLKKADHMLSPYAMWNITLLRECDDNIPNLLKYKNIIDLELIGEGKYVEDTSDCNPNLDYYYKRDDFYLTASKVNEEVQPTSYKVSNPKRKIQYNYKFGATSKYGSWIYTPIKV